MMWELVGGVGGGGAGAPSPGSAPGLLAPPLGSRLRPLGMAPPPCSACARVRAVTLVTRAPLPRLPSLLCLMMDAFAPSRFVDLNHFVIYTRL